MKHEVHKKQNRSNDMKHEMEVKSKTHRSHVKSGKKYPSINLLNFLIIENRKSIRFPLFESYILFPIFQVSNKKICWKNKSN